MNATRSSRSTELRTSAIGADEAGPAERGTAEARFGGGIGRMLAVAEDYPQLRATENFQKLQTRALRRRGEDLDHAPRLQRHGRDLQHQDPGLPLEPDRRRLRLRAPASSSRPAPAPRSRPPSRSAEAGGVSTGSLIWEVLWRLAIVGVVYLAATWGPDVFQSDAKHYEISDREHPGRAPATNSTPARHRDARVPLPRGQLQRRLPRHPAARGRPDLPRPGAREREAATRPGRIPRSAPRTPPTASARRGPPGYAGVRVVWHYPQTPDQRTFTISYDVATRSRPTTTASMSAGPSGAVSGTSGSITSTAEIVTPDGTDPTARLGLDASARTTASPPTASAPSRPMSRSATGRRR